MCVCVCVDKPRSCFRIVRVVAVIDDSGASDLSQPSVGATSTRALSSSAPSFPSVKAQHTTALTAIVNRLADVHTAWPRAQVQAHKGKGVPSQLCVDCQLWAMRSDK